MLVRTGKAAELLGVHQITIYRYIKRGILPATRLPSGEYRIDTDDLDTMLTHGKLTATQTRPRQLPNRGP